MNAGTLPDRVTSLRGWKDVKPPAVLTLAQATGIDGRDAIEILEMRDLNAIVKGRGMNKERERRRVQSALSRTSAQTAPC